MSDVEQRFATVFAVESGKVFHRTKSVQGLSQQVLGSRERSLVRLRMHLKNLLEVNDAEARKPDPHMQSTAIPKTL